MASGGRGERFVVIGGGVVGASAAYHLAKTGAAVTLVDRHDTGQATAAGAGIIAPGTSMRPLPAFYPFAADAVRYYPELIDALADDGAPGTGYEVVGELFLAFGDDELARLDEVQRVMEERRAQGMPNLGEIARIAPGEARRRFPALGDIAGAIEVPEAARVDGGHLRDALLAGARKHGAEVRVGSAVPVHAAGRIGAVAVGDDQIPCAALVLAGGAWSDALTETLGISVPVAPQRGQIAHLTMAGQDTSRWPILGGFGDQYILTFGPDRVVTGATRETGSGYDVRMTAGGLHSVLGEALRVAPGLKDATLHEVRIGLRPLSADGLPFIGRLPGHANVIVATGHGPSGLQLGPYSGLLAARLAMDQRITTDLTPFAVDRVIPAPA